MRRRREPSLFEGEKMDCEKCPVMEICYSYKGEASQQFTEETREQYRKIIHTFCPLEGVITTNIARRSIEFGNYLKGKGMFEEAKK